MSHVCTVTTPSKRQISLRCVLDGFTVISPVRSGSQAVASGDFWYTKVYTDIFIQYPESVEHFMTGEVSYVCEINA